MTELTLTCHQRLITSWFPSNTLKRFFSVQMLLAYLSFYRQCHVGDSELRNVKVFTRCILSKNSIFPSTIWPHPRLIAVLEHADSQFALELEQQEREALQHQEEKQFQQLQVEELLWGSLSLKELVNPYCAEFISGRYIACSIVSYDWDGTGICNPFLWKSRTCLLTLAIAWLLMASWNLESRHQQLWYWQSSYGTFSYSHRIIDESAGRFPKVLSGQSFWKMSYGQ